MKLPLSAIKKPAASKQLNSVASDFEGSASTLNNP